MNAERLASLAKFFGTWLERLLASGIVVGIIAYGIELVRTLLTHSLEAILELLAFVVARKTFKADVNAFDIFLCALAFVAPLGARHFFLRQGGSILFKSEPSK